MQFADEHMRERQGEYLVSILEKLSHTLFRSPRAKTAIPLALSIGVGMFSNFLVTEMTVDGRIVWISFYGATSFYFLLAFVVLTYLFHRHLYHFERDIFQFKEQDYCVAYARSQLIPAHVDAAKAQIAGGDTARFETAMKQVQKILK